MIDALAEIAAGDVLATHSPTCLGRVIQLCSGGYLDHLAIVAHHLELTGTPLVVWEAWYGRYDGGFRWTPIDHWLAEMRRLKCEVRRFPLMIPLTEFEAARLAARCLNWEGRPYDFKGATRARVWGGRWLTKYFVPCREDDGTLFCNEGVGIIDRDVLHRVKLINASAETPTSYLHDAAIKQGARYDAGKVNASFQGG